MGLIGSNYKLRALDSTLPSNEAIVDRVFKGFQAARSNTATPTGYQVTWGMQYGDASQESVAICNRAGHLVAIAIVNGYNGAASRAANSSQTFSHKIDEMKKWGETPVALTFFASEKGLKKYFPLFRYWLAADLLGMNTNCHTMKEACAFSKRAELNIHSFVLNAASSTPHLAPNPKSNPPSFSLDIFVQ